MLLTRMLRGLIWVGLSLIFLVPLVVSSSLFFPFITGKGFFFRIVVAIIFAAWLVLLTVDRSARPKRSLLLWSLVIFVAIVSLATIFGANPTRSFWSNFERMEGLITHLHLLAYWLVLISVVKTEAGWRRLLNISLGVSTIVVIYGLVQLAGAADIHQSSVRLDATFGNAIYLAVYLLIHIFFCLYLLLDKKTTRFLRWVYGVLAIFQVIILYYTATRGAALGLFVGFFIGSLLIIWKGRSSVSTRFRRNLAIALGVIILLGAGFWAIRQAAFVQNSPVLSRFAGISLNDRTTEARLVLWQMSLKGFTEHPVLGWGPENYNLVFNKYYDPRLWNQEQWFDRSHNIFLDWLISAGILGLLSYLSLFGISLYYLWRHKSPFSVVEASVLTGLLAAYFVHNIFVFDNLMSYIMFAVILGYVHHRSTDSSSEKIRPHKVPGWGWPVIIVSVVGLIFVLVQVDYRSYVTARDLVGALNTPYPDARLELFNKVLASGPLGRAEAREQLISSNYQVIGTAEVPLATKQAYVVRGLEEMEAQIKETPTDTRYLFFEGVFFGYLKEFDRSIARLKQAHESSPGKQSVYFSLISVYLDKGDLPSALVAGKEAFDLDHDYPEARRVYALLLLQSGKVSEARAILTEKLADGSTVELDQRFPNILAANKQDDLVLKAWQDEVAKNPTNIDSNFKLAAAYFLNGDKENSIKVLQKIGTLDPKEKVSADHFIEEIKAGRNPLSL